MFQGLKESLALQAEDETLIGTSSSMQHLLYLLLIAALATARNWIRWTYLRLPGNAHAANSWIFRELDL